MFSCKLIIISNIECLSTLYFLSALFSVSEIEFALLPVPEIQFTLLPVSEIEFTLNWQCIPIDSRSIH